MSKEIGTEKPIGKVTLAVRGERYEATIERLTARAADSRSPWHKDDVLQVWLDFERSEGKHPGGTLGFGIELPARPYKREELLQLIKTEGERRLAEIMLKSDEDHAYQQAKDQRQAEVDKLASQLNDSLSGGDTT